MVRKTSSSILVILILVVPTWATQIDSPKLTPVPSTEKERTLIKDGIALHDRGDFDGAILKYEEVLNENPHNVLALYELAYSYYRKKDYRKSLEIAYKGAQYKSDSLNQFYVVIGNSLDLSGDHQKAVEVYKAGIKAMPNSDLLHYNLAVTYNNLKKPEEAKKSLKVAVFLNPNHASSHFALGSLLYQGHFKTPALLALSRFLILEPRSSRSVTAYKLLQEILKGGVTQGKNPNEINIFVETSDNKDEGDFESIEMFMGLAKAATMTEKGKGMSEVQLLVEQVNSLLGIITEIEPKGDKSKFTWKYYIPYFVELKKRDFVEPFVYYISQKSKLVGAEQWLAANNSRMDQFLSWSKLYQWAKH